LEEENDWILPDVLKLVIYQMETQIPFSTELASIKSQLKEIVDKCYREGLTNLFEMKQQLLQIISLYLTRNPSKKDLLSSESQYFLEKNPSSSVDPVKMEIVDNSLTTTAATTTESPPPISAYQALLQQYNQSYFSPQQSLLTKEDPSFIEDFLGKTDHSTSTEYLTAMDSQLEKLPIILQHCFTVLYSLLDHPLTESIMSNYEFRSFLEFLSSPILTFSTIQEHLLSGGYGNHASLFYQDCCFVFEYFFVYFPDSSNNRTIVNKLRHIFERCYYEMVLCIEFPLPVACNCCHICRVYDATASASASGAGAALVSMSSTSQDEVASVATSTDVGGGRGEGKVGNNNNNYSNSSNNNNTILGATCERCDGFYHLTCLEEPYALTAVPRSEWYCPSCIEQKGIASSHPYRSASVKHPLRYQNKMKESSGSSDSTHLVGEVVGIEVKGNELIFVIDFQTFRECWKSSDVRTYSLQPVHCPDINNWKDYDFACCLASAYSHPSSLSPFSPSKGSSFSSPSSLPPSIYASYPSLTSLFNEKIHKTCQLALKEKALAGNDESLLLQLKCLNLLYSSSLSRGDDGEITKEVYNNFTSQEWILILNVFMELFWSTFNCQDLLPESQESITSFLNKLVTEVEEKEPIVAAGTATTKVNNAKKLDSSVLNVKREKDADDDDVMEESDEEASVDSVGSPSLSHRESPMETEDNDISDDDDDDLFAVEAKTPESPKKEKQEKEKKRSHVINIKELPQHVRGREDSLFCVSLVRDFLNELSSSSSTYASIYDHPVFRDHLSNEEIIPLIMKALSFPPKDLLEEREINDWIDGWSNEFHLLPSFSSFSPSARVANTASPSTSSITANAGGSCVTCSICGKTEYDLCSSMVYYTTFNEWINRYGLTIYQQGRITHETHRAITTYTFYRNHASPVEDDEEAGEREKPSQLLAHCYCAELLNLRRASLIIARRNADNSQLVERLCKLGLPLSTPIGIDRDGCLYWIFEKPFSIYIGRPDAFERLAMKDATSSSSSTSSRSSLSFSDYYWHVYEDLSDIRVLYDWLDELHVEERIMKKIIRILHPKICNPEAVEEIEWPSESLFSSGSRAMTGGSPGSSRAPLPSVTTAAMASSDTASLTDSGITALSSSDTSNDKKKGKLEESDEVVIEAPEFSLSDLSSREDLSNFTFSQVFEYFKSTLEGGKQQQQQHTVGAIVFVKVNQLLFQGIVIDKRMLLSGSYQYLLDFQKEFKRKGEALEEDDDEEDDDNMEEKGKKHLRQEFLSGWYSSKDLLSKDIVLKNSDITMKILAKYSKEAFYDSTVLSPPSLLQSLEAYKFMKSSERIRFSPSFSFSNYHELIVTRDNPLQLLKMALFMIEASLPAGSIDDSEERWGNYYGLNDDSLSLSFQDVWREALNCAVDPYSLMQCQLMLEYGIRTAWLKPTGLKYFSCLSSRVHALRNASYSMIALRIWCLDMTIKYDKLLSEERQQNNNKKGNDGNKNKSKSKSKKLVN
jgi:hypothetical protein